jgi:hypothetical protein
VDGESWGRFPSGSGAFQATAITLGSVNTE